MHCAYFPCTPTIVDSTHTYLSCDFSCNPLANVPFCKGYSRMCKIRAVGLAERGRLAVLVLHSCDSEMLFHSAEPFLDPVIVCNHYHCLSYIHFRLEASASRCTAVYEGKALLFPLLASLACYRAHKRLCRPGLRGCLWCANKNKRDAARASARAII